MDSDHVVVPGGRDVRATLDWPDDTDPTAVVVACPPHPQHRGHRGDDRLTAVSDALTDRGVACLRFDYGDWDEGYGERADAENALRWARERFERVGLFGFSFGGAIALLAAARADDEEIAAVSTLAPAPRIDDELDAVAAVASIDAPLQVIYGSRDDTVDSTPVADAVRDAGGEVIEWEADHFFVGRHDRIGERVAGFLVEGLSLPRD